MVGNPLDAVIDANVVLRQILGNDAELSPKAVDILRAVEDGRISAVCDPVTLAEIVWVLRSFYRIPRAEVSEKLLHLVKSPNIRMLHKQRYILALELFAGPVGSFGDACCCAAALEETEGRLLSFDRDLSKVAGITRREDIG